MGKLSKLDEKKKKKPDPYKAIELIEQYDFCFKNTMI